MAELLTVRDTHLEVEVHPGERDGPVLVFLHEGLGSVAHWRDFPAGVASRTDLPALVYSRRGYGRSSALPAPWGPRFLHEEATWLPEVLAAAAARFEALRGRPFVSVGHSDGASIALLQAGCVGPMPYGLIAMAPHVFVEDLTVASIAAARDGYATSGLSGALGRYHADADGMFAAWSGAWLDPAFRTWDMTDVLPRVRCPVLVMQGLDDAYGTLAQVDAVMEGVAGPAERLLLPGCGHSPPREARQASEDAIVAFVESRLV